MLGSNRLEITKYEVRLARFAARAVPPYYRLLGNIGARTVSFCALAHAGMLVKVTLHRQVIELLAVAAE
jgi:hypothetical protein